MDVRSKERVDLSAATRKLPARTSVLIRGGYVMTMDAAGDLPGADVHVDNGGARPAVADVADAYFAWRGPELIMIGASRLK
jgi:hypothetical protein